MGRFGWQATRFAPLRRIDAREPSLGWRLSSHGSGIIMENWVMSGGGL